MIKVVFFDVDNTLLSFTGHVKDSMREGFKKFGLKPYEDYMFEVFDRINNSLWQQIEKGTLQHEELLKIRWNTVFKELGIEFDGMVFEDYFKNRLYTSAILEPGAKELVEALSNKYMLCVSSNGHLDQQLSRLKLAGLLDKFEHVFVSFEIGAQKPSKEYWDYCFTEVRKTIPDLKPEETIIIGDSLTADISGAVNYGMHTCYYKRGRETVEAEKVADYIVNNLSEVNSIL